MVISHIDRHIKCVKALFMALLIFTKSDYTRSALILKLSYDIDFDVIQEGPDGTFILNTKVDVERLNESYHELLHSYKGLDITQDSGVVNALILMSDYVLRHTPVLDEASFRKTLECYTRQDLLRLYVFCYENLEGDRHEITLRSKQGSIRLQNCCNWFREELMRDYLETHLPEIVTLQQAKEELLTGRRKRGREPKDARIPALLWGTYQALVTQQNLPEMMPNALCQFLIQLLQLQEVLPLDTEIDTFWIRAQLRYLRSKGKRPSFPPDNQSSMMKGAQ